MAMVGLEHNAFVLILDGKKALLFQNTGDAVHPKLVARKEFSHADLPAHELGTDAPGRTFSSADGRRSAIEPADPHLIAEERFVKHVTDFIDREAYAKHFEKLVIVAPAKSLAVVRKELSKAAQAIVVAEFDKDLVKEPVHALELHLQKMLGPKP